MKSHGSQAVSKQGEHTRGFASSPSAGFGGTQAGLGAAEQEELNCASCAQERRSCP